MMGATGLSHIADAKWESGQNRPGEISRTRVRDVFSLQTAPVDTLKEMY